MQGARHFNTVQHAGAIVLSIARYPAPMCRVGLVDFTQQLATAGVTPTTLSSSALDALDSDGVVVVPALDAPDVAALREAFDIEHGATNEGFTQHVRLTPEIPAHRAWLRLCAHPVLLAAAAHVLKRRFRIGDLHGRSALPGGGLQGLHADWPARESALAPPPG